MIALIMAGGSGTRFWPLSRENNPKQYLKLFNNKSMIRLTYERCLEFTKNEEIYVVTTENQVKLIQEHIPELNESQIIIEPSGRNTAPCIALAIIYLSELYEHNETILILPADHYVPDTESFKKSIFKACEQTSNNRIITFGVTPTYPATGYGYIESGAEVSEGMFLVKHFKEKPDLLTATAYLSQSNNIYWNTGMFCCTISSLLDNFELHCPHILMAALDTHQAENNFTKLMIYSATPKTPIDIAILEVSNNVCVIPIDYAWSDVGNWFSLSELLPKDSDFNFFNNTHAQNNSSNNFVISTKFVALLGVSDLVIINTEDTLMILHKNQAEHVKSLVDSLKSANNELL